MNVWIIVGIIVIIITVLIRLHRSMLRQTEKIKIIKSVTKSQHPIMTWSLVHLNTRHTQREHTCGLIFQFTGHIVIKGKIDSQQRRESLIDAHGRNIVHAARYRIACGGCGMDDSL